MLVAEGRGVFDKINQLAGGSSSHILRMFSYSVANLVARTLNEDLIGRLN
jgi:hypothetical protein